MKLFYRVLRKEEAISISRVPSYKDDTTKDGPPAIENMLRPPTPPPSPKPSVREPEAEARNVEPPRALETNTDKETRTKKPRCEVTPVMRTPDPPSAEPPANNQSSESAKSKDLTRLEHRKRRKRRNKRVIAEITTTPREDLLKLKVRLTPRPPRITSGAGTGGGDGGNSGSGNGGGANANNQAKEKLLQLRSVRREKIKTISQQQRWTAASTIAKEEIKPKECATVDVEETIEDIIDSIPDEVVCIAQNINNQSEEVAAEKTTGKEKSEPIEIPKNNDEPERPKKDEEILRRLGLVAINEISGDKTAKQRAHSNVEKSNNLDREKLEKQLRESKANRVRSLLAEKQMRDALKSIMSKTKEERSASDTLMSASTSVSASAPVSAPKKKEPPPLAPLRVAKPSGFAATSGVLMSNTASKYETPLDLSSGGTVANDNALDLSATLPGGGRLVTFSSSSSSPSSSSSSSSSSPLSCSMSSLSSSKTARSMISGAGGFLRKSKEHTDQHRKGQQESNLRTLSDVAVSRLSGCLSGLIEKNPAAVEPFALASTNIHAAANKVALRIPQPHQRISGFGMKIKPNLGVRHIPNPQAVVASQYRNQRANYFNTVSQQPP